MKKTKLQLFDEIYKKEIINKQWITKSDMTVKGFFPKDKSNGKDIRFVKTKYEIEEFKSGNRITKFKILGLAKDKYTNSIQSDIVKKIKKEKCSFLNTYANIEVDHKNGRYNDPRVLDIHTQVYDDFQPLSKIINNLKREHCKKCKTTGKKFDATTLGFLVPNLNGEDVHNNLPNGCEGCFFHDIKHFKCSHKEITKELSSSGETFSTNAFFNLHNKKNRKKN